MIIKCKANIIICLTFLNIYINTIVIVDRGSFIVMCVIYNHLSEYGISGKYVRDR